MAEEAARQAVRTLLEAAGVTVEAEDFDAVVRLYERFAGQRALLSSARSAEVEPLMTATFHPRGDYAHERR